jgi:hypothetical protein
MQDSYNQNWEFYGLDIMQCMSRAMHKTNSTLPTHAFICNFQYNPWFMSQYWCLMRGRDVLISNVGMIEGFATWRAHNLVVLGEQIDEGRDVFISNVGMIEVYATWRAHDHVVLGKRIDEGRAVLISNVGMIEEYATWRAHDHVVLGKRIDEGRDVLISMWAWSRSMQCDVFMIM